MTRLKLHSPNIKWRRGRKEEHKGRRAVVAHLEFIVGKSSRISKNHRTKMQNLGLKPLFGKI